jgi:excinuclease ABC subunit B
MGAVVKKELIVKSESSEPQSVWPKAKKPAKAKVVGKASGGAFVLKSNYEPAGDQPAAIAGIVEGLARGEQRQTILGVTGSGKTFAMAKIIQQANRPAMIMAPNKTLAAQLYAELRDFFPDNAVEYFVSYYDYYQPEAYVPAKDLFIEKDSAINEHIEQMRLSATKSLLERRDVIIVATVSAIYGLGSPDSYHEMILSLRRNGKISRKELIGRLVAMQYKRAEADFQRGTFRVRGDTIDVFPSEHAKDAVRIELDDDEVEKLTLLDALTGRPLGEIPRFNVYPASHYVAPEGAMKKAAETIKAELEIRLKELGAAGKVIEAHRLKTRTEFDLEMIEEIGFCKGIENYSRHLSGKAVGEPPDTLFDYLPEDAILFMDESHVGVPQIGGMSKGDQARKTNLVDFGFRLVSAMDNRPLRFEEFEQRMPQTVYVSATPADYEKRTSTNQVELVIRPTGIVDPKIEVRPAATQIDDLLGEIHKTVKLGWRVLVTSLTKKMAEQITEYFGENNIKAKYLHSDVDNIERVEILRDLRKGEFDVLVGINLLREGLDLPEVALVAILDADKEGFLRSDRSLIQTIGRAARNPLGRVILYGDKETESMKRAMAETARRREKQLAHNAKMGIEPKIAISAIKDLIDGVFGGDAVSKGRKGVKKGEDPNKQIEAALLADDPSKLSKMIKDLDREMRKAAESLDFEKAAGFRDKLLLLKDIALKSPL